LFSFAGVRMADNMHTSPVLEVHTWKESRTQRKMHEATMTQRIALGGMQTERDTADRHIGPSRGAEQHRIEVDEEVFVLPIESILSIKYSTEIKKGHTVAKNVRLKTPPPPVKLSCCEKIGQWCKTTFCCCGCCDDPKAKVHVEPEQIMTTITDKEAERKILITIEYVHYSNIDTPSHVRVLGTTDQLEFYKEHLHIETLKFYLLDNYEYEQTDFDLKRMQASTLCRLVTQLKTMTGHYPDESTLQMIIGKRDNLAIGDPSKETIVPLVGPGTSTTHLQISASEKAIEDRT
jgi:hypothetical protein